MFVVLNMDIEEMEKRVSARHEGDEQMVEMMKVSMWLWSILGCNIF